VTLGASRSFTFSFLFAFFRAALDIAIRGTGANVGAAGPIVSPFSIALLVAGPGAQLLVLGMLHRNAVQPFGATRGPPSYIAENVRCLDGKYVLLY